MNWTVRCEANDFTERAPAVDPGLPQVVGDNMGGRGWQVARGSRDDGRDSRSFETLTGDKWHVLEMSEPSGWETGLSPPCTLR